MKHKVIVIIVVLASYCSNAQTFDEWFRQKKTQKKYLLEQIAAFKVYLDYVQKGYFIVQKGLTAISHIKKGDFDLHRDFFASLANVNPKISAYAKVGDIVALQIKTVQVYKDTYKQVRSSGSFDIKEMNYIFTVFTNIQDDCSAVIAHLSTLIAPNELEMKDDQRLKRIDMLYSIMQEHYTFAQSFGREARLLAIQRLKEKKDIQMVRALSGIKN